MITLRSKAEVEKIEAACRIVADTLEFLETKINPGITGSSPIPWSFWRRR